MNVLPFGPDKAGKLVLKAEQCMDSWIAGNKVRCSGEISKGTFVYDVDKSYADGVDGTFEPLAEVGEVDDPINLLEDEDH